MLLYMCADENFNFSNFYFNSSAESNNYSFGMTLSYGKQFVANNGTPRAAHSIVFMCDLQKLNSVFFIGETTAYNCNWLNV